MTSEDVEDIKRYMDAAAARIHVEVHEILSRNGFLDRILAWRAQNVPASNRKTSNRGHPPCFAAVLCLRQRASGSR